MTLNDTCCRPDSVLKVDGVTLDDTAMEQCLFCRLGHLGWQVLWGSLCPVDEVTLDGRCYGAVSVSEDDRLGDFGRQLLWPEERLSLKAMR